MYTNSIEALVVKSIIDFYENKIESLEDPPKSLSENIQIAEIQKCKVLSREWLRRVDRIALCAKSRFSFVLCKSRYLLRRYLLTEIEGKQ